MSVRELDHLVVHFGLIEVVVFPLVKRRVGRNALCTFDRVILTKVTFLQNTVNGQTTVAAKIVVVGVQDVIAAFLAAMVASLSCIGNGLRGRQYAHGHGLD
jgi:hypothetical protein